MRLRNDAYRIEDDVCVDITYANPTGPNERVLFVVASRKVWGGTNCSEGVHGIVVFAEDSWEYDQLYPGFVSQGHLTAHTLYRHAADTGAYPGTVREYDIEYDALGNPVEITRRREDGTWRTVAIDYDRFGLAAVHKRVKGTNVPTLETFLTVDPVTSELVGSTDENGAVIVTLDGFRRPVLEHMDGRGGVGGVISATSYLGFAGGDLLGRRVVVKEFTDPVDKSEIATHEGRTITTFLDELGRTRFDHVALGEDYANETLIVGARTYDPVGRVAFEADSYPASQDPGTAYGTTRYFDKFGALWVEICGRGPQTFNLAPDPTVERYPTVFSHAFANHMELVVTQTFRRAHGWLAPVRYYTRISDHRSGTSGDALHLAERHTSGALRVCQTTSVSRPR